MNIMTKPFLPVPARQPLAVLLAIALMGGGCASHDKAGGPASTVSQTRVPDAAGLLAQSRSATRTFETRLGLAVGAADLASKAIAKNAAGQDRMLYNNACTEVAVLSRKVTLPITLKTPVGIYRLSFGDFPAPGCWNPSCFSELIPTGKIKNRSLVASGEPAGYGGVLVGVRLPENSRAFFLPWVGVSAPVTAVLNTGRPPTSGGPIPVTLTLCDPAKRETARIAGMERMLAADFTAPFGYYPNPSQMGVLGMVMPGKFFQKEGLFLLQPYDPKKIPLLFIHGLMSDPQMWLPVIAAIEKDPALRERYQIWVYAYPTGNPTGYSALELREALRDVYKVYPKTRDMVIVNHSLGGVLTHLQVIDSGTALVDDIFKDYAPKVFAMPDDSVLKRALIFKANPRIARVVFVAAPHRGAPLAVNPVGNFGANLIRVPDRILSNIGTTALNAAIAAGGVKHGYVPNSIHALDPSSPLLKAMNSRTIKVPFHSIIGVAGKPVSPLEKTSDTVVPYWSSHLDGALSEKIVPYPHTAMFVKPEATDEIGRILKLHLAATGERR